MKHIEDAWYARALLDAFVTEARSRGARRIWTASYDFQAPGMYEKAGFKRMAEFEGWPEGHINVVLCKTFSDQVMDRCPLRVIFDRLIELSLQLS